MTPDEKYLQPDPVGVVCRHCGEPIVRYYNQAYKWAHRNGFVTCRGGVTIAGPVPVVPEEIQMKINGLWDRLGALGISPEEFKGNAENLNSEGSDSSSVVPETPLPDYFAPEPGLPILTAPTETPEPDTQDSIIAEIVNAPWWHEDFRAFEVAEWVAERDLKVRDAAVKATADLLLKRLDSMYLKSGYSVVTREMIVRAIRAVYGEGKPE